uniref:Chemosensory protein n=2 Tax=Meteorus pulchricornis TaxID=51522 RepID=A0A1S5VFI4_9HYME
MSERVRRIRNLQTIAIGINVAVAQSRSISFSTSSQYNTRVNMKVAVVFIIAVVAVVMGAKYTTKYDNVDLDQILKSNRLLNNYVDCLLSKRTCTPDGKELKENLPDALKTECAGCSEKQKAGSEKVIRYIVNQRPDLWEQLAKVYDPNNEYRVKFQDKAEEKGIKI